VGTVRTASVSAHSQSASGTDARSGMPYSKLMAPLSVASGCSAGRSWAFATPGATRVPEPPVASR
jgi:hypothetical protein